MTVKKGIIIGDRIFKRKSLLAFNGDWSVSFGTINKFEFIAASAVQKRTLEEKYFRNETSLFSIVNNWFIACMAKGDPNYMHSNLLAEILLNQLMQNFQNSLSQSFYHEHGISNIKEEQYPLSFPNQSQGTLIYPLDIANFKNIPKNVETHSAGSLYWFDRTRFNFDSDSSSGKIDLEKMIAESFDKTWKKIKKLFQEGPLHIPFLCVLLNIGSGELGIINSGAGEVLGITKDNTVRLPLRFLSSEYKTEFFKKIKKAESPQIIRLNSSDFKTLILISEGLKKDLLENDNISDTIFARWANALDKKLNENRALESLSENILNWLSNYKLYETQLDKTLIIIKGKNNGMKNRLKKLSEERSKKIDNDMKIGRDVPHLIKKQENVKMAKDNNSKWIRRDEFQNKKKEYDSKIKKETIPLNISGDGDKKYTIFIKR